MRRGLVFKTRRKPPFGIVVQDQPSAGHELVSRRERKVDVLHVSGEQALAAPQGRAAGEVSSDPPPEAGSAPSCCRRIWGRRRSAAHPLPIATGGVARWFAGSRPASRRSASSISRTRPWNVVVGFQPRTLAAFEASPHSSSTSVGRK